MSGMWLIGHYYSCGSNFLPCQRGLTHEGVDLKGHITHCEDYGDDKKGRDPSPVSHVNSASMRFEFGEFSKVFIIGIICFGQITSGSASIKQNLKPISIGQGTVCHGQRVYGDGIFFLKIVSETGSTNECSTHVRTIIVGGGLR